MVGRNDAEIENYLNFMQCGTRMSKATTMMSVKYPITGESGDVF